VTPCFLVRAVAAPDAAGSHVRSSDASVARIIDRGIESSPTFKRLVSAIDGSDGIVYVQPGVCAGRVAACLPAWMQSSGSYRYLRIVVDRKRLDSDRRLAGVIGHELQHAIEVLGDPSVTDGDRMFFFYKKYAPTGWSSFETPAAIDAGLAVEDEWRAFHHEGRAAEPLRQRDGHGRRRFKRFAFRTGCRRVQKSQSPLLVC